jgi:hypothetical protein
MQYGALRFDLFARSTADELERVAGSSSCWIEGGNDHE